MQDKYKKNRVVYHKLVRDRIPEIIKKDGKKPFTSKIKGEEFNQALGRKILEEAGELFAEWTGGNAKGILKESADMLEITLAALEHHGFTFEDLAAARSSRAKERGGFEKFIQGGGSLNILLSTFGNIVRPEYFSHLKQFVRCCYRRRQNLSGSFCFRGLQRQTFALHRTPGKHFKSGC